MARTDRRSRRRIQRAPLVVLAAMGIVAAWSTTGPSPGPATPPAEAPVPVVGPPGTMLATAGPYRVVAVSDVDTIVLDRGNAGGTATARLVGLAPPDIDEGPRCFGAEAAAEAHRLLDGQEVRIVADPGWPLRDGDGRLSVYVWLDSGRMANHLLVEGGFAREATGAPAYLYREPSPPLRSEPRHDGRGSGRCRPAAATPRGARHDRGDAQPRRGRRRRRGRRPHRAAWTPVSGPSGRDPRWSRPGGPVVVDARAAHPPPPGHHRAPVLGLPVPGRRGPGRSGGDAGHRPPGRGRRVLLRPVRGLHPEAGRLAQLSRPGRARGPASRRRGRRSSTAASGCSAHPAACPGGRPSATPRASTTAWPPPWAST